MRARLAAATLILGLLITGGASVVAYLTRTALRQDVFSERVVASLDRPAIASLVARQIANGVVAANRDLTGIKPVITTFAEAVVGSSAFKALAQRAARDAHQAIFSQGAESILLSVPDVGVLLRGTLETVSPEIARRIPGDVQTVIAAPVTGRIAAQVLRVLRAAARVRLAARIGLIVGLLMIVVGVIAAPARRQAVVNAGIGFAAIGALLALVVPLGGTVLSGAVADPSLRPVVRGLWLTFAEGVRPWAIGDAAAGLMLVAGAAAVLDRFALLEVARRGMAEIAARQQRRPLEAVRVAALLAIGGFAVATPLAVLAALVVLIGTVILVVAVHELVALLAPSRVVVVDAPVLHLNPALGIAAGCVIITAAGLGIVGLALRFRPPEITGPVTGATLVCNGAAALCDRRLDEITLPGAHNAMGSADNPAWMFPNQDANLAKLLRRGVRAFMLDVWTGQLVGDRVKTQFASEDERRKFEAAIGPEAFAAAMRIRDRLVGEGGPAGIYLCHGFCELGALPFDTALAQVKEFLVANPNDIVLLILEDYAPPADVAAAFARTGLLPYVYTGPSGGPFPTLRDMIASNQRLFVMGEHRTDDIPWYHPAYDVMQETPYTFHAPEEFSCRPNRGERRNPLFLMNHWIETTPSPKPSNAAIVNTEAELIARARQCRRERGKLPNIIAVDFAATGDVVRAAVVLNGLGGPEAPVSGSPR